MNQSKVSILCVDDNKDNCDLLTFVFEQEGFEVKACETIDEGLFQARQRSFSAVILDNNFGQTTGLDVCRQIRWFDPVTPIIFYSGETRESEIEKAFAAGANAYLIKANDFGKLAETVSELIKERQAKN